MSDLLKPPTDPGPIHNFSAGPAALPPGVRENLLEALKIDERRMPAVMEISHRTPPIEEIGEQVRARILSLCGLKHDDYEVLLMPGGARMQFTMVPLNLATYRQPAYLESGYWSNKAMTDAERLVKIKVAGHAQRSKFTRIPAINQAVAASASYLHYCGNESIQGIQYPFVPAVHSDVPVVADLTSEFLSRRYEFERLGIIYASAQKNFGIAGLTVVIIRRDLLARIPDNLPHYFDYRVWARSESMFNTPCTLAWFITLMCLKWIESCGGLKQIEETNIFKGRAIYHAINFSHFYTNPIVVPFRSRQNIIFYLADRKLEPLFAEQARKNGFIGLRGHRSMGGFRASIYNGVTLNSTKALASFMQYFEQRWG